MMKKLLIVVSVLILLVKIGNAQELNCNFSVNTNRIQGTNKQVFETLEKSIREFLNNTVWTNHVYEPYERIECNILLDIQEIESANEYSAKLQIQARRPIYGTSYNTVLLNYIDNDVEFSYQEYDPLEYSETSYISNLSSVLSFYVYFILGLDYDSFSLNGGTPYFQTAEKIVNLAQSSGYSGWMAADSRERKNRYWYVENMLDSDYEPLRKFNYQYHRQGLDLMKGTLEQGRQNIYKSVQDLKRFYDNKPDPFVSLLQVFMDSKSEEIVDIFSEASSDKKLKIYKIMNELDPSGSSKYSSLKD